jgi:hypothetical protein
MCLATNLRHKQQKGREDREWDDTNYKAVRIRRPDAPRLKVAAQRRGQQDDREHQNRDLHP